MGISLDDILDSFGKKGYNEELDKDFIVVSDEDEHGSSDEFSFDEEKYNEDGAKLYVSLKSYHTKFITTGKNSPIFSL